MLLYPPMKNLLEHVSSRYMLVNVVAHRARELSNIAEKNKVRLTEKPVTLAVQEVANGELTVKETEE